MASVSVDELVDVVPSVPASPHNHKNRTTILVNLPGFEDSKCSGRRSSAPGFFDCPRCCRRAPCVKGSPGDSVRQPHIAPSPMLVAPCATMALMADLTVDLSAESGKRGAVVHMKFGPPGKPAVVMLATVALLADVPYLQFRRVESLARLLSRFLPPKPLCSPRPTECWCHRHCWSCPSAHIDRC